MELLDLTKDVRHLLLSHWTQEELETSLKMPDYFFEHVVIPRMEYLKRTGKEVPKIRLKRSPKGELLISLNSR